MAQFRAQAERFGAQMVDVDIERVDFSARPFRVWARGVEYRGQAVIVATGASALWLGLDSEARLRGAGVSACATCDGFFFRDQAVAVVGGGTPRWRRPRSSRASRRRCTCCTGATSCGQPDHAGARACAPEDRVPPNVVVEEVLGDAKVHGIRLRDVDTDETSTLEVDGMFVAIGYKPNTDVFRDWLDVDAMGYLVVRDETGSKIDGIFVAGDVHDHRYRQAVTAAGDGCKAAIDAERWLASQGIAEAVTATAW
jgi:thioredoxin reductase (NADPH)